jgi:hypothetical protein
VVLSDGLGGGLVLQDEHSMSLDGGAEDGDIDTGAVVGVGGSEQQGGGPVMVSVVVVLLVVLVLEVAVEMTARSCDRPGLEESSDPVMVDDADGR